MAVKSSSSSLARGIAMDRHQLLLAACSVLSDYFPLPPTVAVAVDEKDD